MSIIRFILLVFLGLMVRRMYLAVKRRGLGGRGGSAGNTGSGQQTGNPPSDPSMQDLTEQDISDADFEEIP